MTLKLFTWKEEVLALENIIKGSGRDFRLVYVEKKSDGVS